MSPADGYSGDVAKKARAPTEKEIRAACADVHERLDVVVKDAIGLRLLRGTITEEQAEKAYVAATWTVGAIMSANPKRQAMADVIHDYFLGRVSFRPVDRTNARVDEARATIEQALRMVREHGWPARGLAKSCLETLRELDPRFPRTSELLVELLALPKTRADGILAELGTKHHAFDWTNVAQAREAVRKAPGRVSQLRK